MWDNAKNPYGGGRRQKLFNPAMDEEDGYICACSFAYHSPSICSTGLQRKMKILFAIFVSRKSLSIINDIKTVI